MTLGELINGLEYYWEKYGANAKVLVPDSFGGLDDVESVEYSTANDSVVIW